MSRLPGRSSSADHATSCRDRYGRRRGRHPCTGIWWWRRDQRIERFAMRGRAVGPIGLDRIPKGLQAFVIGVAVLDNDRRHPLGVLEREAISDGRAVIHDVHGIALHAQLLQQAVHEVGVVAEAVVEGSMIGCRAEAEPRIIGGDDMVFVRQQWYQVTKHMRRGREAVQQDDSRSVRRACFAVEDLDAVNGRRPIMRNRR